MQTHDLDSCDSILARQTLFHCGEQRLKVQHMTCHTPHVTRHTSHVTRHTSHATRHLVLHQVGTHRAGRPPLAALAVHVHEASVTKIQRRKRMQYSTPNTHGKQRRACVSGAHCQAAAEVALQLVGGLVQHRQRHRAVVVAREYGALLAAAGGGERFEALLLARG